MSDDNIERQVNNFKAEIIETRIEMNVAKPTLQF